MSTRSRQTLPEAIFPGQLAINGTCMPPRVVLPFSPANSPSPSISEAPRDPVPLSPVNRIKVFWRSPSVSNSWVSAPICLSIYATMSAKCCWLRFRDVAVGLPQSALSGVAS